MNKKKEEELDKKAREAEAKLYQMDVNDFNNFNKKWNYHLLQPISHSLNEGLIYRRKINT